MISRSLSSSSETTQLILRTRRSSNHSCAIWSIHCTALHMCSINSKEPCQLSSWVLSITSKNYIYTSPVLISSSVQRLNSERPVTNNYPSYKLIPSSHDNRPRMVLWSADKLMKVVNYKMVNFTRVHY